MLTAFAFFCMFCKNSRKVTGLVSLPGVRDGSFGSGTFVCSAPVALGVVAFWLLGSGLLDVSRFSEVFDESAVVCVGVSGLGDDFVFGPGLAFGSCCSAARMRSAS